MTVRKSEPTLLYAFVFPLVYALSMHTLFLANIGIDVLAVMTVSFLFFYASWWARWIMQDIQNNILQIVKSRSERGQTGPG